MGTTGTNGTNVIELVKGGPTLTDIERRKGVTIIDFFKQNCGPCNLLAPTLASLARDFADRNVILVLVDIDEFPEEAARYSVMSAPTVYIRKDGFIETFFTGRKPHAALTKLLTEVL